MSYVCLPLYSDPQGREKATRGEKHKVRTLSPKWSPSHILDSHRRTDEQTLLACSRTEIMLCLWNHKCRAHWVVSALLTCPFVFPLRESAPSPTCRWTQANSCKSSEQSTRILWPRSAEYLAKDNRQYWPAGDRNPGKGHAWRTDQPIGRLSSLETRKEPNRAWRSARDVTWILIDCAIFPEGKWYEWF
jgi:hypothetical protein